MVCKKKKNILLCKVSITKGQRVSIPPYIANLSGLGANPRIINSIQFRSIKTFHNPLELGIPAESRNFVIFLNLNILILRNHYILFAIFVNYSN
jgi:hypothetical protein